MGKIYAYNNSRNMDIIPEQLYVFPVTILLGKTLGEVKDSIENDSDLFFVYTPLKDADIYVQNDIDYRVMNNVLTLAGLSNIKVKVQPDYIWYTDKAKKNVIISDSIKINKDRMGSLLHAYFNQVKQEDILVRSATASKYYVINTRNSSADGPYVNLYEAKRACDGKPCTIVRDNLGNTVYKSKYGKAVMVGNGVVRVGTGSVGFDTLKIKVK